MGFNDQAKQAGVPTGAGFSLFKDGVKVKWMGGKALGPNGVVAFRILPAHNPADLMEDGSVNPYGWLPSRAPSGDLTDWGFMIEACRFVGHKSFQMDFLSPVGIDNDRPFLLDAVYRVAVSNNDWNYLVKREKEGKTPPMFGLPRKVLMLNVLLVDGGLQEIVLAGFTSRAIDALLAEGSGLLNQQVEMPAEMLAQNHMLKYRVRDITHPTDGYVVQMTKKADNTFTADIQSVNGTARKVPIDSSMLPGRYPLYAWQSLMNLKSQEQVVEDLLRVFSGRNAAGVHEHYLLKEALEPMGFNIPTPAAAPAAGHTIPGGFEKPAAPAAPATAPGVYVPPAVPPTPPVAPPAAPPTPPVAPPTPPVAPPAEPPAAPPTPPAEPPAAPPTPPVAPPVPPAAAAVTVPGDPVPPPAGDQAWMAEFMAGLKS